MVYAVWTADLFGYGSTGGWTARSTVDCMCRAQGLDPTVYLLWPMPQLCGTRNLDSCIFQLISADLSVAPADVPITKKSGNGQ